MTDKQDRIERLQELKKEAKRQEQTSYYSFLSEVADSANILNLLAPQKRKFWIADVLDEMYVQQNAICPICGLKMNHGDFEVDHIVPHKFGGGNESSNIQLVHPKCNRIKGESVEPSVLLRYLEDRFQNL
jgi:5-methylcytosine-specific restriction endonuclease McrA